MNWHVGGHLRPGQLGLVVERLSKDLRLRWPLDLDRRRRVGEI